jgi:hypothetical protein
LRAQGVVGHNLRRCSTYLLLGCEQFRYSGGLAHEGCGVWGRPPPFGNLWGLELPSTPTLPPPPDRRQLARGGAVRISSYSPTLTEVEVQFLPVAEVGIGGDARLALLPDLPLLPCPRSSFARE